MKFSILIPVFNAEKYLEDCIESILSQTYTNFEIILIDDGSTDKSGLICDNYAQRYPNIVKTVHNQNQGPLKARICGVKKAIGDICLFVDADDYIRMDSLEVISRIFKTTDSDMVIFNLTREPDFRKAAWKIPFRSGQCFSGKEKSAIYRLMITTQKLNSLALKAVKRRIATSIPDEYIGFSICHGEDFLQSALMVTVANKICYVDQNLYYYRSNPESIVHTYDPIRHKSLKVVHAEIEKFIDVWEIYTLHGEHYAREVRGWIDCLIQAAVCPRRIKMKDFAQLCAELSQDEYFRNAYLKMEHGCLSKRDAILAKWLYKKYILRVILSCIALRTKRKVVGLIKAEH